MDGIYTLIKSVMQAFPGFTINDVLQTDYGVLMKTIDAKTSKPKSEPEAMDLFDFVKSI